MAILGLYFVQGLFYPPPPPIFVFIVMETGGVEPAGEGGVRAAQLLGENLQTESPNPTSSVGRASLLEPFPGAGLHSWSVAATSPLPEPAPVESFTGIISFHFPSIPCGRYGNDPNVTTQKWRLCPSQGHTQVRGQGRDAYPPVLGIGASVLKKHDPAPRARARARA